MKILWNLLYQYNNIYKRKKSTNGRLKKKNVAIVPLGTITNVQKKKKCLTKALLLLQCLYSANTLNAQRQSIVAALLLFICTSVGWTCKACAAPSEKININFVCKIVNFSSPNLIILKRKFKNTTKYHNIFTISSFLGSEMIFFLFERNATFIIFLEQIINDKLLLVLK